MAGEPEPNEFLRPGEREPMIIRLRRMLNEYESYSPQKKAWLLMRAGIISEDKIDEAAARIERADRKKQNKPKRPNSK